MVMLTSTFFTDFCKFVSWIHLNKFATQIHLEGKQEAITANVYSFCSHFSYISVAGSPRLTWVKGS